MNGLKTRSVDIKSLEAVLFMLFFLFTYFIQNMFGWAYHITNASYISLILLFRIKGGESGIKYTVLLSLFYFVVFHQYSADPYNDSFTNFQSGFYKIIVLMIFSSCCKLRLNYVNISFCIVITISTLYSLLYGGEFRSEYIVNDAFFYSLLFIAISLHFYDKSVSRFICYILYKFSLLLPLACFIIYISDLGVYRFGSYYYFYGHLFFFLLVYPVFFIIKSKVTVSSISKLLISCNIVIFLLGAQSAQYLIFFILLFYYSVRNFNVKYLILFFAMSGFFVYLYTVSESGSWLSLKIGQVILLLTSTDLNAVLAINSLAVRIYQFIIIYSSNDIIQDIIGNGLGAIYTDPNSLLQNVRIHEYTFPEKQLLSGEFYLIHESAVKYYFNSGVLGFLIIASFVISQIAKKENTFLKVATVTFWFMLVLSGVQFGAFISILYILIKSNNGIFDE